MKYPRLTEKQNKAIKLTKKDIANIRILLRTKTKKYVAKKYGVSEMTLWLRLLPVRKQEEYHKRKYELRKGKADTTKKERQLKSMRRKVRLVPQLRVYAKEVARKNR